MILGSTFNLKNIYKKKKLGVCQNIENIFKSLKKISYNVGKSPIVFSKETLYR